MDRQLGLFPDVPGPARGPVPAVRADEELVALRRALPAKVRLGTSSWSFPGWVGIVFGRRSSPELLARHGLAAYAQHPILRAVGLDRTYYAPLEAERLREYAQAVPEDFRFVVKAHELCTMARFSGRERHGGARGERNPLYLDPAHASEAVVGPFVEGLGSRGGALVFQFPPQRFAEALAPEAFAERIASFLTRLPRGPLYAIEIRHRRWLTEAYADALAVAGAVHCVTVHPTMPDPAHQARVARLESGRALVVRWMLGKGQEYDAARERYAPFDRLVDPDLEAREVLARLCLQSARRQRPAYVAINNKAEGSAPLSAIELARRIAALESEAPLP